MNEQTSHWVPPVMHAAVNGHRFDLWCTEPEWLPFQDQNYVYETDVVAAFMTFVRPGDVCIDAGANLGYHSLLLSRLVGDSGLVLAYEPDPTHFDKLKANVELNGAGNIYPFRHALWSGNGNLDFWSVRGGGYSSLANVADWNPTRLTVPTVRLDDVINPDIAVRLIKIDCEGAEEQILHGAEQLLRRTVDVVVLEFNIDLMRAFNSSDRSIRDYMDGLGYDFFVLRRDGSQPFPVPLEMAIVVQGRQPYIYNGMFVKR